jgi:hypothetical protein
MDTFLRSLLLKSVHRKKSFKKFSSKDGMMEKKCVRQVDEDLPSLVFHKNVKQQKRKIFSRMQF